MSDVSEITNEIKKREAVPDACDHSLDCKCVITDRRDFATAQREIHQTFRTNPNIVNHLDHSKSNVFFSDE